MQSSDANVSRTSNLSRDIEYQPNEIEQETEVKTLPTVHWFNLFHKMLSLFRKMQNANANYEKQKELNSGAFVLPEYNLVADYELWWSKKQLMQTLQNCPEDTAWNIFVCMLVLVSIVLLAIEIVIPYYTFIDVSYNVVYAIHMFGIAYNLYVNRQTGVFTVSTIVGFLVDVLSYAHYFMQSYFRETKLLAYYLRLHRPFRYLWAFSDYNLKSSVLGTTLKYLYIFFVIRLTWGLVWLQIEEEPGQYQEDYWRKAHQYPRYFSHRELNEGNVSKFLRTIYLINKMFIPIGPSTPPNTDMERIVCMLVMISGGVTVSGCAVASLSSVIAIYMGPEETFRSRYRLIMKDMQDSDVSASLREKVKTFYKMYWRKQKAVSSTQLLPTFPHWIPDIVYTDIYFKATQKSRILCDLSYQFLCEIVKDMQTIHYIPGDTIIKRTKKKSSIIYITYGDIEMLTAEDDSTAMLRMSRGTVLSGCAGCPPAGCVRAHVDIRAATFCTAHVLKASDLWRTAYRFGRSNGQAAIILASFYEHFERVKRHYYVKVSEKSGHKSSIRNFKRNLMNLKNTRDHEGNLLLARTDIMLEIAGCYIMRNRADSLLMDESDEICLRSTFPCILQPRSVLLTIWNSLICCLIVVVCFTHPYYIAYKKVVPLGFRFYDYVVTCIYVLDIFVYLSTGTKVEDGVPISLLQTASQQIRSYWFVLDVLATTPIFEFIGDCHFAGINKLLRLPKVFRTLKSFEDDWVYYSNVLRFFSYSLLLLIACYFVAALQETFMCFYFSHCSVTNFTHPPFWAHIPADEEKIENSLTFGLYWAVSIITFTTHKETGCMANWSTVLYTMLLLELCIILHIFIAAVYSATIMVTTAMRENYDSVIADVTGFLIRNNVEPLLRYRFITYLQLCWYTDMGYSITNKANSIYHDLPPHVYQDIVNKQRSKYILCIPFMKFLSKEDLKTVSTKAVVFCTSPNEILLNTGDISNEMYVIKQGICEIIHPETKAVVNELRGRNCFGVLECLLRIPAFYTIRAATHVQIFSISRKYVLNAVDIPQIADAIEFAKEQPEYTRLLVSKQPFLTYQPPAPIPNREYFRRPRKHEPDHAFLHPFKKLGFLSVLRYIFPRFTIRPDGEYLQRAEWVRGCCALMTALLMPGYPYLLNKLLYMMVPFLDYTAYFDIIQRMLVGYYNERGVLVYHPASTADHYIRGAFLIDLFACLPLEKMEALYKELYPNRFRIAAAWQFLMLNRLVQLYRLPGAIQGLERYMRRDIVLVISATPLYLSLLNVMTCIMVFNSADIFISPSFDFFVVPKVDHGGSWINLFQDNFRFNLTENPWNLHLACFFWVVYETTTTGYNVLNPSNLDIMKILFVGMLVGAMITTYYSVRIISVRSNVNNPLASFQQHMKDMAAFMRREDINEELQKDVHAYYGFNWDNTSGQVYRHVFKLCDQITLRTDAILQIYGPTFSTCPILYQCDVSLLRIIGRAMRSVHFLEGTRIVKKDDVILDLLFVDAGTVELIPDDTDNQGNIKLTQGSIFGDLDGHPSYRSPVDLITTSKVHLLHMKAEGFNTIISDFPDIFQLVKTYRPNNENYILGNLGEVVSKIGSMTHTDVNLTPETQKGIFRYIHFENGFIQFYLLIVSLFCMYGDIYNAGFQDNGSLLILILYSLDIAFMFKFIFLLATPNDAARKPSFGRKRFWKGDTKYDILSCIPLELGCLMTNNYCGLWFSILRLNRLFRVVTVYAAIKQRHKRLSIDISLTTIISVVVWFTLLIHSTACLWHFIGYLEDLENPKSSWIYRNDGSSWCNNLYVCSLYFLLTTSTQNGVGDIMPRTQSEIIYVSIVQIVAIMLFMIYVGEVSNILQYQSYRSFDFYCKILELQDFLKNNRVSKNLVKLVNKYSRHLWRDSRGVQVPYFLKTAPLCLRLRLMSDAFMQHLQNNVVFQDCEPAFLRQLVGCLRLFTYYEGLFVVTEHEIRNSMYFIHKGQVAESSEDNDETRILNSGKCFGEGLIRELPYTHSYRTVTPSQILTLRLNDWIYLLKHFPPSKNTIYKKFDLDDSFFGPQTGGNSPRDRKERKSTIFYPRDMSSVIFKKFGGAPPRAPPEQKSPTRRSIAHPTEKLRSSKKDLTQDEPRSSNSILKSDTLTKEETDNNGQKLVGTDDSLTPASVPPLTSTTTLQGSKASTSDIRTLSSLSLSNMDNLLQLEDKIDVSAQPSNLDIAKDDDVSLKEGLISKLSYTDIDINDQISIQDMKTVDEYILERRLVEDSVITEQPTSSEKPTPEEEKERHISDDLPASSRGNRFTFHVRYKDVDSDDEIDEIHSLTDTRSMSKKLTASKTETIKEEDTQGETQSEEETDTKLERKEKDKQSKKQD